MPFSTAQVAVSHAADALSARQIAITHAAHALSAPQIAITHAADAVSARQMAITHAAHALSAPQIAITHAADAVSARQMAIAHAAHALSAPQIAITHAAHALSAPQIAITHAAHALSAPQIAITHAAHALSARRGRRPGARSLRCCARAAGLVASGMPGVVAAGQRDTAEAAARILRLGGNPVDAAIAGCAAAFVAEPLLCSAGGAGIMTVALDGAPPQVIDFFSDMPGLGSGMAAPRDLASRDDFDFQAIRVDFGPAQQTFHVGRASAAMPGMLPGLAAAHARFGSLPLSDLMAPAIHLAHAGVTVSAETAHVFGLLWGLLAAYPDTARVLAGGALPRAGGVLRNPELGETLRAFGATGRTPERMLEGLLAEFGPARGGLITEDDVRSYRPRIGPPVTEPIGDWTICMPPSPGGHLAMFVTRTLAGDDPRADEAGEMVRLAQASQAAHAQRNLGTWLGSTTHISVLVPGAGAAAVTLTSGEGCGHLVPGTGVHLNNFLGEEDLNPHGFHRHAPGQRLPTMIAPCVGLRGQVPCLALGSGGSNRIRSAVGEVLYRRVVAGMDLAAAVAAPRVHAEADTAWLELHGLRDPAATLAAMARVFATVHRFPGPDFFFGGVHAVDVDDAGTGAMRGAADLRRGGVVVQI
jgi:gamma-glutamyltranspeptidase/glutathione hydrolase